MSSSAVNQSNFTPQYTLEEQAILASSPTSWTLVGICIVVTVTTVLANLAVLVCFVVNENLRKPFNYILVNLAVSELICGALAMSHLCIYTHFTYWPLGPIWCAVWLYFDWLSVHMGLLSVAIISMDRLWASVWPISYRHHNTIKKSWYLICASWIIVSAGILPGQIYNHLYLANQYGRFDCYWAFNLVPVWVTPYYLVPIAEWIPTAVVLLCYVMTSIKITRLPSTDVRRFAVPNLRLLSCDDCVAIDRHSSC